MSTDQLSPELNVPNIGNLTVAPKAALPRHPASLGSPGAVIACGRGYATKNDD